MSQKKLKIIHIEDEPQATRVMKKMIERFMPELVVYAASAGSIKDAEELVSQTSFDLILLDIVLPDGTGIDFLNLNPSLANKTILCTSDDTKGIAALKLGVFDYILKPISVQELRDGIERFISSLENEDAVVEVLNSKLLVPTISGVEIIPLEEVVYLSSDRNYTNIFLTSGEKLYVSKTLKYFSDMLDETYFLRIHKSTIVHCNQIRRINKISGGQVELIDGTMLKLSEAGKEMLKKTFNL